MAQLVKPVSVKNVQRLYKLYNMLNTESTW